MSAAGIQPKPHQTAVVFLPQYPVPRAGFLAARADFPLHCGSVGLADGQVDQPLFFGQHSFGDGQIFPLKMVGV